MYHNWLVVTGTMEFWMTFHSVGNVIIPTDELHHFSEGFAQPPTSWDSIWFDCYFRMLHGWFLFHGAPLDLLIAQVLGSRTPFHHCRTWFFKLYSSWNTYSFCINLLLTHVKNKTHMVYYDCYIVVIYFMRIFHDIYGSYELTHY